MAKSKNKLGRGLGGLISGSGFSEIKSSQEIVTSKTKANAKKTTHFFKSK